MKPTVSRIVHYVSYGTPGGEYYSTCRAALVAEVGGWVQDSVEHDPETVHRRTVKEHWDEEMLGLVVTNPTGLFFNRSPHDETEKRGGTWHWPERDDA